jgi:tetratricopeptide (TPR) repeat protein
MNLTASLKSIFKKAQSRQGEWLPGLGLVLTIAFAYSGVSRAGFIWDDDAHVTNNPCVIGPAGLAGIWTTAQATYYPLVLTTFWIQHALWGLHPVPFHWVNVAFHAGCAVLLWIVLRDLKIQGAWIGAALWALHPVNVESVAWITELKNTQSCLFFLLTVFFYIRWRRDRIEGHYVLALVCAMAAILSKTSTVVLPAVLVLCSWWLEGNWRWRNTVRLVPFFLISIAASVWTIWEQKFHSGAVGPEWDFGLASRFVIAGRAVWFYLGKLIWPHPLVFIYPRWNISPNNCMAYSAAFLAVLALATLWSCRNKNKAARAAFFAAAYFLVCLFPVLGFFNIYFFRYSFVGDHFQYLASISPAAAGGAAIATAFNALGIRRWKPAMAAVLLIICGVVSSQQWAKYIDGDALYRDTIRWNPGCWLAYNNLGLSLEAKSRTDAIALYQKALVLKPDYAEAHNNLGSAYLDDGQLDEAVAEFFKALETKPDYVQAQNNLGNAYLQKGQDGEAMKRFSLALEIKPNFALANYNIGNYYLRQKQPERAIARYQEALRSKPDFAQAHYNLAFAYLQGGKIDEAISHLRNAVASKPDYTEAENNLGNALLEKGRVDEAIEWFRNALRSKPDFAQANYNLGRAYFQKGKTGESVPFFRKAAEADPNDPHFHSDLGIALTQSGQMDDGLTHLETAAHLAPDDAQQHRLLAIGYAKNSRTRDAVKEFENAVRLRPSDPELERDLGRGLSQLGRIDDAVEHYEAALKINPSFVSALNELSWILATTTRDSLRDGQRALELAQSAMAINNRDPGAKASLAAAYAERGLFSQAATTAHEAIDLASDRGNASLAATLRSNEEMYKAGKALRISPTGAEPQKPLQGNR